VRDALQRLEAEFFTTRVNGRSFVPEWSTEDMEDLFALRAMLEGYAAARAAERLTPQALEKLQYHHSEIDKAISPAKNRSKPDIDSFLSHNRDFHRVIMDASGSKRLTALLTKLVEQPIVLRTALFYESEDLHHSHQQHGELLMALKARDPVWARATMTSHIQRALHVFNDNKVKTTARARRRHSE
jgi:DNA-binding GntR family transcriptional regulator